ncbi:hypothetical protein Patl1_17685 [Pistacia atlantica]|uniref:Uncharacterized protein n=1 Tax=Pistacia atlantica TaxID=434234 RepID=A0ACC1BZE7_9ROSI|nr:hypothetical protein Patl1_17685 [Pistacia atlantica]
MECIWFAFVYCSPPCVSYILRKRALYNDMSRYVCCVGYMPCSGKCCESSCTELCLGTEVYGFCLSVPLLCFSWSMFSASWLKHNYGICGYKICLHFFSYSFYFKKENIVASTRFLLQDEFNIQTTRCDNFIIVLP